MTINILNCDIIIESIPLFFPNISVYNSVDHEQN